jgi:hypothetical protein
LTDELLDRYIRRRDLGAVGLLDQRMGVRIEALPCQQAGVVREAHDKVQQLTVNPGSGQLHRNTLDNSAQPSGSRDTCRSR